MAYCPNCGSPLNENSEICPQCGGSSEQPVQQNDIEEPQEGGMFNISRKYGALLSQQQYFLC
ncbi:hypothetical protein BWX39_08555 [Prevotella intermedia ATCC 25611 = DSM 20706]|uniref:zinc-ribbon domain-containing protein n=1 Tax=Prevotella intermedia TaxID=28131 RepID=UPI0009589850|nr:zinc-ribbon domain-containing protein [Prevotella intermedia]APW32671.1 hypothetical protein BWX39_08555 [Prevotella intermedia ATCC 25611 = DSM 20706]